MILFIWSHLFSWSKTTSTCVFKEKRSYLWDGFNSEWSK